MHRSRQVDDAIKRYSREANLEIDKIKKKLFVRKSAEEESLKTVSESTKFKYSRVFLSAIDWLIKGKSSLVHLYFVSGCHLL